jgi:hypothetical protein
MGQPVTWIVFDPVARITLSRIDAGNPRYEEQEVVIIEAL